MLDANLGLGFPSTLSTKANSFVIVSMFYVSSFLASRLFMTPSVKAMITTASEMRGMVFRTWLKRWIY